MGRLHIITSLLVALALLPAPALAVEPYPENLYYNIEWNGIPLGRVRLTTEEADGKYYVVVDTKSKGLASMFDPFRTLAQVSGDVRDGRYIPRHYKTQSETDNECERNCGTRMEYDENGALAERILVPPNLDPAYRPIVSFAKANTATDPISAYMNLRAMLREHTDREIDVTSTRSYDGKRLARLTTTLLGKSPATKDRPALLHTQLTRKPIAGYTKKELKKFKEGDPEILVDFRDESPPRIERVSVSLAVGTITVERQDEK